MQSLERRGTEVLILGVAIPKKAGGNGNRFACIKMPPTQVDTISSG